MKEQLASLYEEHHKTRRPQNFAILIKERGAFLRKHIGTGKKVLDIGCRDGALMREYMNGNTVTGVDIDRTTLAEAAKLGITTKFMDLNDEWTELGVGQFDVVVAAEFLEHIYYPERVLKKIVSVLKPGGLLVGSVPNAFSLKNRLRFFFGTKKGTPLEDPTHINHFSRRELLGLLRREFVSAEILPLVRKPFSYIAPLAPGLIAFDLLFVARKA